MKIATITPVRIDDEQAFTWFQEFLTSYSIASKQYTHLFLCIDKLYDSIDINLEVSKVLTEDQYTICYNKGILSPGETRNVGIREAYKEGYDLISFIDVDDICTKNRFHEIKMQFVCTPKIDVLYSDFDVIDENNKPRKTESLVPSLQDIKRNIVYLGENCLNKMVFETGYITLTSTITVRTKYAFKYQFPILAASEDYYAWMCYAGAGATFVKSDYNMCKYRVPTNKGSTSRERLGRNVYTKISASNIAGFTKALAIQCEKIGVIDYGLIKKYIDYQQNFSENEGLQGSV